MKCEQAQPRIALAVYGELAEDERLALEEHLLECAGCREELNEVRVLEQTMSLTQAAEPSANSLARGRLRLEEALDRAPRGSLIFRAWRSMRGGVAALGSAPMAASLLLVFGLGLGGYSGYRAARNLNQAELAAARSQAELALASHPIDQPIQVANISNVVRDPSTHEVEIQFNRLVPDTFAGSLEDPEVRQLLLLGARSPLNPGVQQTSVTLLAQQCREKKRCPDGPMRRTLLVALRYDQNAAVRLHAMDGLEPYIADDMRVRDAILESLMSDPDPALRSHALQILQPVQVDTSVREVLHTVAAQDTNPHIRTVSREVLAQMPQIQ